MTSFALKMIAMVAMLIDHIGLAFFQDCYIFRVIGRLALPIFCFQIAVGFEHTRNREKYLLRLLIFALISQIPYTLYNKTAITYFNFEFSIAVNLLLGFTCLYLMDKTKSIPLKFAVLFSTIILSIIIPIDYSYFAILIIVGFYFTRKLKFIMCSTYILSLAIYCFTRQSLFNLPGIFSLIPICLYNGKKGKDTKWLLYAFYPIHLLILFAIMKLI